MGARRQRRLEGRLATALVGLLFCAAAASAQVRVSQGEDGRMVITNEAGVVTPRQAPRRPRGVSSETRSRIDAVIERHAAEQGLDPSLVRAVVQVESAYDERAVSRAGALGLMQLMPATAAELSVRNPFDPEANVRGGTTYLPQMLDEFGNELTLALAGYNAGPGAVHRYGGIPPYRESQQYVRRVLRRYRGEDIGEIAATTVAKRRPTFLIRRDGRLVMTNVPPGRR